MSPPTSSQPALRSMAATQPEMGQHSLAATLPSDADTQVTSGDEDDDDDVGDGDDGDDGDGDMENGAGWMI